MTHTQLIMGPYYNLGSVWLISITIQRYNVNGELVRKGVCTGSTNEKGGKVIA
jgi:hypothetical protein